MGIDAGAQVEAGLAVLRREVLLVGMGLLLVAQAPDLDELDLLYRALTPEQRYFVLSNLSILSLLEPRRQMPDPVPHRARLAQLMARLEGLAPS